MNKQETRERIISTVKEAIGDNIFFEQNDDKWDECNVIIDVNGIDHIAEQSADELIEAGYIKSADFVSNVAWRLADKIVWENHGRIFDLEEINQILNEALQEYLKGE